jgi:hypothetical protein
LLSKTRARQRREKDFLLRHCEPKGAAVRSAANKNDSLAGNLGMMPVRAAVLTRPSMIGFKRFVRPGLIISAVGHGGALVVGLLLYVGGSSFKPIPPDAMVVDIVPPNEAPRLQGTPSDLRSSGSSFKTDGAAAAAQPPPKPAAHQQPQSRSKPERNTREATEQPQTQTALAETAQAETARAQTAKAEASAPRSAPPQPHPEQTPDQPDVRETLAQLALMGGPLGGGFNAPAVNTLEAAYDFTAPFREHISSCSTMPAGVDAGDQINVKLWVFLNPDGTLASPPKLIEPIASRKERALMQSAIDALQKCQPYTMLPADKYEQWKTLGLVFFPLNFSAK